MGYKKDKINVIAVLLEPIKNFIGGYFCFHSRKFNFQMQSSRFFNIQLKIFTLG
jgi:hypothetical protein